MTAWLDRLVGYERQGLAEVPGPASNPIILHWLQVDGGGASWVKDDATPWCAATMCGVFTESGLGHVIPGSEPLRARQWLTVGTDLGKTPRVGAIAVLPRGKDPKAGHVGLVRYVKDGRVGLLGGNQRKQGKDCVCTVEYPVSAFLGFRWPLKEKTPKEMAAESRITAAASRQKRDQAVAGTSGASIPVTPPPAAPAPPEPVPGPIPEHVKEGIDNILTDASWFKSASDGVVDFASFVGAHWWWIAGGVCLYFLARSFWDSHQIQLWRTEDTNKGYST